MRKPMSTPERSISAANRSPEYSCQEARVVIGRDGLLSRGNTRKRTWHSVSIIMRSNPPNGNDEAGALRLDQRPASPAKSAMPPGATCSSAASLLKPRTDLTLGAIRTATKTQTTYRTAERTQVSPITKPQYE